MALAKVDIAELLVASLHMSRKDAKHVVEFLFEEIRQVLAKGDPVRISGFGNFELRDKGVRPGRNPKTGQDVPISARRVVTFKAGQKLKIRVGNYQGNPS